MLLNGQKWLSDHRDDCRSVLFSIIKERNLLTPEFIGLNVYKYCHVFRSVTIDGVWIGELDLLTHLYTPLETTSNYSAIANLFTLQITTATAKPFSSLLFI
jgi:hypothetical protein